MIRDVNNYKRKGKKILTRKTLESIFSDGKILKIIYK